MDANEQLNLQLPGPRITRVTIGRLHNLGNYEHVRYEITVDLAPGNSPAAVVTHLTETLDAMNPQSPVSDFQLRCARADAKSDDPKRQEESKKVFARHEEWMAGRAATVARFDELGGTKVFTDAKDRWDNDQ